MGNSHSTVVFQGIFFIVLPVEFFLHPDHNRIIRIVCLLRAPEVHLKKCGTLSLRKCCLYVIAYGSLSRDRIFALGISLFHSGRKSCLCDIAEIHVEDKCGASIVKLHIPVVVIILRLRISVKKQVALLIIHIIKEFLFLLIQHVYRIRAALRIRGFPRIGQRPVLCKRVACILIFYKICAPGTVFHKVVPLSRDLIPSRYRSECLRSCRICGNCCHSRDHAEDRCHSSYFSSSDHMIASAFFFSFHLQYYLCLC